MSLCTINQRIKEALKGEDVLIPEDCFHLYIHHNNVLSEHTFPNEESMLKMMEDKERMYYVNFDNWCVECGCNTIFPDLIKEIMKKFKVNIDSKIIEKFIVGGLVANIRIRDLVLRMYTMNEVDFQDYLHDFYIDKRIIREGLKTMNLILPLNENYLYLIKHVFTDETIEEFMVVDLNKSQNLFSLSSQLKDSFSLKESTFNGKSKNEEELFFRFKDDEMIKILKNFKFDYNYLGELFFLICDDDYILVDKFYAILRSIDDFYLDEGEKIGYFLMKIEIEVHEDEELNERYYMLLNRFLEMGEFNFAGLGIEKIEKYNTKWRLYSGER